MIEVPKEFRPIINVCYPAENYSIFEEWFSQQFIPRTQREYLPIFFTSYWVNNNYGNDVAAKNRMQDYVDSLPRDKKYYIICQYDDGVLIDFKDLDVLQFNMSKNIGVPIPLLCMPHSYVGNDEKTIFASFVGSRTHPIRDYVFNLQGKDGYYITDTNYPINEYCQILSKSIFNLAPRGYGINSFRLWEGLQYGTIPVYISDEFIIPYGIDFNTYGVLIEEKDAHRIEEILASITPYEIIQKQNRIKRLYDNHFTYEGLQHQIIKRLES